MDQIQSYFHTALDFLNNRYEHVNGPQGLVIALFAVVLMQTWGQWLAITLGATICYAIVDAVRPIIVGSGALKLPPVTDPAYWGVLAAVYVGLMVIIAMFFAVKKVLFMRGGGVKARAH